MVKSALFVLTVLSTLLAGCSGTQPVVHAQSPFLVLSTPIFDIAEPTCPEGCVLHESQGYYLALRIGPQCSDASVCSGGQNPHATAYGIVLPYDLHVKRIDGWIGTSKGSVAEFESRLQIEKPTGEKAEIGYLEFDKHTADTVADVQKSASVDMLLPKGSKVVVVHNGGFCFTAADCGYDTIWRLYTE